MRGNRGDFAAFVTHPDGALAFLNQPPVALAIHVRSSQATPDMITFTFGSFCRFQPQPNQLVVRGNISESQSGGLGDE
jgi:hypothetical protein